MGGGSKKKQTVGYKYFVGKHMVLCRGPVDFIKEMLVDDKLALSGVLTSGNYTVSKENLFGGKSREGGVSGSLDVLNGEPTQTVNSYLASKLGSFVPAFRGVLSVVLRQMYLGMSPYLKPWSFVAQRIHVRQNGLAQWYDAKAEIKNNDEVLVQYGDNFEYAITAQESNPGHSNFSPPSSGWLNAPGPFGHHDSGPANIGTPNTDWPLHSTLWVRRTLTLSRGSFIRLNILIENGCVVIVNNEVVASVNPDNLQPPPSYVGYVDIGPYAVSSNINLLIKAYDEVDSGNNTFFGIEGISLGFADMNPAHIIRECLTDPDWGMGYAESDIDDTSFTYAADMLYAEQMGMSLLWDTQTSIEEFIQLICRHINATIYLDRRTGLFVLKLIRNDYDEGSLLQLNKSNVSKIDDFSRGTFGELVNSVTVTYWDATTRDDATITISDIALVSMQGGTNNSSIDYEGFTNSNIASRVTQRDLKTLSTPLISCTIYANTDAEDLNIGDVFKLTWPDYDLTNVIMRVATIGYGDGKSNRVRLTCTQDIFSMPDVAYIAPTPPDGVPVDAAPVPVSNRLAFEVPYLEAVQQEGQSVVDGNLATNPDIAYFSIAAARPSSNSINAILYTDSGAGYEEQLTVDFCPFAELSADIDRNATSFVLSNLNDESEIDLNTWFQIGTEIMEVTNLVGTTITVKRGLLDTVPVNHSAGETLFFWDAYEGDDPTQYVTGEVVSGKLSTVTASGSLPISSASADSVTMVGRLIKPYPPGNVKINSSYFPVAILGAFGLTWAHRDRLQQTGSDYIDFLDASIGPESGTTYNLRLYGELDTLLRTENALTGINYDWTAEESDSGIIVVSTPGGLPPDSISGLLRWYDADTLSLTDGDFVSSWTDKSSFANHAVQANSANKPIFKAAIINGKNVVRFDGSNDYLSFSEILDTSGATAHFFIVAKQNASGSRAIVGTRPSSGNNGWVLRYQSATQLMYYHAGYSPNVTYNITDKFNLIEVQRNGLNITVGADGTLDTTQTVSGYSAGSLNETRIGGALSSLDTYMSGDIAEIIIYDHVLTTIERNNIINYLNGKYTENSGLRLNGRIRFELESVRDGKISYQKHNVITDRAGYGYNWGKYWGGI